MNAPQNDRLGLSSQLLPRRQDLLIHPIYRRVDSLPRLRLFMESHVFAVWDFMSLVKRLQRDLCGVGLPWRPPASATAARFVNELVVGEECDLGPDGAPVSHLEAYLQAMDEVGADTGPMRGLLEGLAAGQPVEALLCAPGVPPGAARFSAATLQLALHGSTVEVAAAFLHSREDLIPDMFQSLLELAAGGWGRPDQTRWLRWYLERHIELDGDSHGPLAQAMLHELCADRAEAWERAGAAAERAMDARLALWDDILSRLPPREAGVLAG